MKVQSATLEETLDRHAREIFEALQAAGRVSFKHGWDFGNRRVTIGLKLTDETVERADDLPVALWLAAPKTRDVYRALGAIRAEAGPDAAVGPARIKAYLERDDITPGSESIHSINNALQDLRKKEVAWSHPDRGWVFGRAQPTLPFSGRQTDGPSQEQLRSYCVGMADAGVRRFEESAVPKSQIWVPGVEKNEYGVIITDARTEAAIAVTERTGEMRVPTRSGRLCTMPAARGEVVKRDGPFATVKFAGGQKATVRILGDWQLEGLTAPPEAEVGAQSA